MYRVLSVRKVSTGSVFKLVFIGLSFSLPVTFLLLSMMAHWGLGKVQVNGEAASVWVAATSGLLLALAMTLIVGALMSLGLWLFALFKPMDLVIRLEPDLSPEKANPS